MTNSEIYGRLGKALGESSIQCEVALALDNVHIVVGEGKAVDYFDSLFDIVHGAGIDVKDIRIAHRTANINAEVLLSKTCNGGPQHGM